MIIALIIVVILIILIEYDLKMAMTVIASLVAVLIHEMMIKRRKQCDKKIPNALSEKFNVSSSYDNASSYNNASSYDTPKEKFDVVPSKFKTPDSMLYDGDLRISNMSVKRNDPIKPIIGTMKGKANFDKYLREEVEEQEDSIWWGRHEY
jgi:hypothetical protein